MCFFFWGGGGQDMYLWFPGGGQCIYIFFGGGGVRQNLGNEPRSQPAPLTLK